MTAVAIVGAVVAIIAIGLIASYNRFRSDQQAVGAAWATVDVELTRRAQLVPQLVEVVRATATHERELLVRAAQAAARAETEHTVEGAGTLEPPVASAALELVGLREKYPQLNSQQAFLDLQQRLSITEDRIAAARRFYNTRVAELNRRIVAFPSNLVAQRIKARPAVFFEA